MLEEIPLSQGSRSVPAASHPCPSTASRDNGQYEIERSVPLKVREIIKLIEADGWYLVTIVGSHRQYKHPLNADG